MEHITLCSCIDMNVFFVSIISRGPPYMRAYKNKHCLLPKEKNEKKKRTEKIRHHTHTYKLYFGFFRSGRLLAAITATALATKPLKA